MHRGERLDCQAAKGEQGCRKGMTWIGHPGKATWHAACSGNGMVKLETLKCLKP